MKQIITLTFFVLPNILLSQFTEQDVRNRLELIHSGNADQVRNELPELQRKYSNEPGVKYLDACLTENGDLAVKKFQGIVDQFPQSDWADDALYKVYQYYYSVALYKTADAKMKQLNEQYPNSIYAQMGVDANEKKTISEPQKSEIEQQQSSDPENQSSSVAQSQSARGKFAVQVGVFSQEVTAQKQAQQYTQAVGREASVYEKESGGRILYAVVFEGFENEHTAKMFGTELKSKFNLDWFIVKR